MKSVENLKEAGYKSKDISVNILIGLPNQRPDEVESTIEFLSGFNIRINIEEYSPVPGSADFKHSGLSMNDDPLLHNNTCNLLRHPYLSKKSQMIKDKIHHINSNLG